MPFAGVSHKRCIHMVNLGKEIVPKLLSRHKFCLGINISTKKVELKLDEVYLRFCCNLTASKVLWSVLRAQTGLVQYFEIWVGVVKLSSVVICMLLVQISGTTRIFQTGAPTSEGTPTYYLANFCPRKLHEWFLLAEIPWLFYQAMSKIFVMKT